MFEGGACWHEGAWNQGSDWQAAHERLVGWAKKRGGLDFEEGKLLLAAQRARVHERLGFGSFAEYVERLLGYGPRLVQDKVRVAAALETLPATERALKEEGGLCWSVVRELTRVATAETEAEWLTAAQGCTVREAERLVSGHAVGSRPDDPRDRALERHVLRFDVSGEVLATFREALSKLRRESGESLDDDAALLLMARQVLEGPRDDGKASYQVALTVCEECGRGQQEGRGELIDVGADVVEMACCDAQHIGPIGAHVGVVARAAQEIPPATRRFVLRRDRHCCRFPACRHATFVDVHHIDLRAEGGRHDPNGLITLCGAHHRALHRGRVSVEGTVSTGLRFLHADGRPYGSITKATETDLNAKAFQALRNLGFREGEARNAIRQASTIEAHSVESLVRASLAVLTTPK